MVDTENQDVQERYPLHRAARESSFESLKTLLESGKFNINEGTFDLVRPLHEACLAGSIDCVSLLLKHGANVNLGNIDGATALCDACWIGSVECVQLLIDHGADVNPPFLFSTPLHEAVFRDHWECVQLLVKKRACIDKSDCHYGTPLHVAACKGHVKSAQELLRAGANPNISKIHHTPLHEAARNQNFELLLLLLEHGANVYAQNNSGLTARQLVPRAMSPCKQQLLDWESFPRSLRHYCRLCIRNALGPKRLIHVDNLPLPKIVLRYLEHY
ncbi:ankyrin repeat and SOCS box protein 13 [Biomphalaria pfeifferi]|uniref:Ankyrin repeat and SOCS box protein 13 n=1 Tax=Biomphalaria pfeifferi TaxID=112525 RepID=A0AAD8BXI2_BIOPF|nr:ankyrin repeat and SOCS box protein 13 [Biomphalaria pfeifferi]